MRVTKLSGERFNLALDRFQEGDHLSFKIHHLFCLMMVL